jgi:hypothetical protein
MADKPPWHPWFFLIFTLCACAPGLADWASPRPRQEARPDRPPLPLLYQTFNFPFEGRIGTPGFPARMEGDARVTQGEQGRYGEALDFPGEDAWIEYPAAGNFPLSRNPSEGSILLWLRPAPSALDATGSMELLEVHDDRPLDGAFRLSLLTGAEPFLVFTVYPSLPGREMDATPCIVAAPIPHWASEEWHHVAITWEGLNLLDSKLRLSIFLDARLEEEKEFPSPAIQWQSLEQTLLIGRGYQGLLDELALFERALRAREIRTIFDHPEGVSGACLPNRFPRTSSPD